MFKKNDLFDTNIKISKNELKRVADLACLHAFNLVNHCLPNNYNSFLIVNVVGRILAKRDEFSNRSELYLWLPYSMEKVSYIGKVSFMLEQIENMTFHSDRNRFTESFLENLKNDKRIICINVYDDYKCFFEKILPLDFVIFYNVHIKNDKFFLGFFQYIMHGGADFGRRCLHISSNSILADYLKTKLILPTITDNNNTEILLNNFEINLDKSVTGKLGNNVKQVIKNMIENENASNIEPEVYSYLKKNIFSYVKRERALFGSNVNIDSSKLIQSFDELLSEKNDYNLFRITAYLINYKLEDKFGIEFCNLAHLRENIMKLTCSSNTCNYIAPVVSSLLPQIFDLISIESSLERKLICPNCQNRLLANIAIQLNLIDQFNHHLTVILSSPEIEQLIGCTNQQLILNEPDNIGICRALNYALKTLCPIRQQIGLTSSIQNDNEPKVINPKLDWILESVSMDYNSINYKEYSDIINKNLYESDANKSSNFSLFYVRSIIINE